MLSESIVTTDLSILCFNQWECKAEMDSAYKFGRLQVSCEGYDYPEDPYILRGSCGVSVFMASGCRYPARGDVYAPKETSYSSSK